MDIDTTKGSFLFTFMANFHCCRDISVSRMTIYLLFAQMKKAYYHDMY